MGSSPQNIPYNSPRMGGVRNTPPPSTGTPVGSPQYWSTPQRTQVWMSTSPRQNFDSLQTRDMTGE